MKKAKAKKSVQAILAARKAERMKDAALAKPRKLSPEAQWIADNGWSGKQ